MSIDFNFIPTNLRRGGVFTEVDASKAGRSATTLPRTLLVGQKLTGGDASADVPVQATSLEHVKTLAGVGSMLHMMARGYLANDPFGEVWLLPLADDGGGAKATGKIQVTAAATGNGTIYLYIGGQRITVGVSSGDDAAAIAASIESALEDEADRLPVDATSDGVDTVTLTARNAGTLGDQIDIQVNYRDGEELPPSVVLDITDMGDQAGGATQGANDPSVDTALANIAAEEFDYIAWPYTDDTNLDSLETALALSGGAWDPMEATYQLAFCYHEGTADELSTHGSDLNDPFVSMLGMNAVPTWAPEVGAAYTGACARRLKIDPKRTLKTVEIKGVLPPKPADRFTPTEQNTRLYDGISQARTTRDGKLRIVRAISTYQEDAAGAVDDAWLDITTAATARAIARDTTNSLTNQYPRHKLANNGFPVEPGQAIVRPQDIEAFLITRYREYIRRGWCQDLETFKDNLVATATSSTDVSVLHPPIFLGNLEVLRVKQQFRFAEPV